MVRGIGKGIGRAIAVFCASILLLPVSVSAVPAFDAPGDGSSAHPYLITTCQQLQDMNNLLGAHYKLMRNIDCSAFGTFTMIGNFFASSPFTGVLDGNKYSIIGLHSDLGGPFGYTSGATIKDLQLINSTYSINTTIYAGTLIDVASNTTLTNVHSSVTMNGSAPQAGGLIGSAFNSTISKSSFTGTITVSGSSIIGGLVALLNGGSASITDSYSYATLNVSTTDIGGLVGVIHGSPPTITRSYSASTLGHATNDAGGLVGDMDAFVAMPLSNSFSASLLNGANTYVGGVVGEIEDANPTGATYYDDTSAGGIGSCAGNTPLTPYNCTTINVASAQPTYFKNNSLNPPFDNWNFTTNGVWQTRTGDYPELRDKLQLHSNTFIDTNGDGVNDWTQGTVSSATDSAAGAVTFVLDPTAHCINDNSGAWATGNYTPADDSKYHVQTSSYWKTDIYCRDAGTAIPVTMILDGVYDTSKSVLRHFNTSTNTYSTISGATFSTVTINGTPKTAVSYTIAEGGPLDPDGTADGFILDPVALVSSTPPVPGAPNTGGAPLLTEATPQTSGQRSAQLLLVAVGLSAVVIAGLLGYALLRNKKHHK